MTSSLDTLVDDVLVQILRTLSVYAVLSLRKTSRRYYRLTTLRCVWYARFCTDVVAKNLPPPGPARPLSSLSATELEQRTRRALYLKRAWPRLSANLLASTHAGARVDQVVFIPGGTEIVTVQNDTLVHWIVLDARVQLVGETTPFEGVPCRIVKDGEAPGVVAVGPRTPFGGFAAKVLSTSLEAPFMTLCDYARVPGVVVGVWRHLLFLDTSKEVGGGLELLDWHAKTTGTAILPRLDAIFGDFLDFVVFAEHVLVVWERCASVFPIPSVPADGQVVVEHARVFMFEEAISRPIGFTTCDVPPRWIPDKANADGDADVAPTLTIAARLRRQANTVSMTMLIPLDEKTTGGTNRFLYRLAYLPSHPGAGAACTTLCLGWSGRGVCVAGGELRLVSPEMYTLPPFEMQMGPMIETGEALYRLDGWQRRDLNRMWHTEEGADACGDKVDFDEGMGRIVVAKERGGFEVVQLD